MKYTSILFYSINFSEKTHEINRLRKIIYDAVIFFSSSKSKRKIGSNPPPSCQLSGFWQTDCHLTYQQTLTLQTIWTHFLYVHNLYKFSQLNICFNLSFFYKDKGHNTFTHTMTETTANMQTTAVHLLIDCCLTDFYFVVQ